MNVRLTQIRCRIDGIVKELSMKGQYPDPREIAAIAKSSLKRAGEPTADLLRLDKHSQFPAEEWDKLTESIVFDLVVLRKVLVDFYDSNKSEFIKNNTRQKKISDDIEFMDNEIRALLGVGDGQYDDFITESFLNTQNILTGFDSVDVQYGNAQLPLKKGYSNRLRFSFDDTFSPLIDIIGPAVQAVIYSGALPDSRFGEAFTDVNHAWIHTVKTKEYSDKLSIEFIVPFPEVVCSQVSIEPHGNTPIDISVSYSVDGVNYVDSDLAMTNGVELQFRFDSKIIKSIKILATIESPIDVVHGLSEYIFGFKNISAINAIYYNDSVIETKFSKSVLGKPIKTIEIESSEIIPDGCRADYFVKGKTFNAVETDWLPIDPVDREFKDAPSRLEMSGTSKISQGLLTDGISFIDRFENIEFYEVGFIPVDHRVNLATLQLYRSVGGWVLNDEARIIEKSVQSRIDLRKDRDVPIHFYTDELAKYISSRSISLKHDVDFNEAGQELIPRSKDDIDPTTAILSVKRVSFGSPIGFGSTGSGDNYWVSDNLSFPVLEPFIVNETVVQPASEVASIIEPKAVNSPGNIFSVDTTSKEEILVRYENGSTTVLTFSVRSLMRIKTVTQSSTGVFTPLGSFDLTDVNSIAIVDTDGTELSFLQVTFINGDIGNSNVASISLNSQNLPSAPENVGAETRGFRLVPNDEHVAQSPDMFKNNDVDNIPTPFPVKIVTDDFSGVYEVDRISSLDVDGSIKPILIITNPEKLGGFIPTASKHIVKRWEILSQDITQEVEYSTGDQVFFSEFITIDPVDRIEVRYRVSTASSTIQLLPETIEAKDSETGVVFTEGVDFLYKDGVLHSFKENIVKDMLIQFKYQERSNNLYRLKTNLRSLNDGISTVQIDSFFGTSLKPDIDAGEIVLFDDQSITVSSVINVSTGWHTVEILSKDLQRLITMSKAIDSAGRAVFGLSNIFHEQRGQFKALSYIDYDALKWSTFKANPEFFSLIDNKVVVPFNPDDSAFSNNKIYKIYKGEDLDKAIGLYYIDDLSKIETKSEEFSIKYEYFKLEEDDPDNSLIESVRIKIELERSTNENSALTPIIDNFKLRIL